MQYADQRCGEAEAMAAEETGASVSRPCAIILCTCMHVYMYMYRCANSSM